MPSGKPGRVPADCHPNRIHWARGMCAACYQTWWRQEHVERYKNRPRTPATCHPRQPVLAQGLCGTCYRRKWRAENPEADKATGRRAYERDVKKPGKRAENAARIRAARYGLTTDELAALLDGQVCAVCAAGKNLHIDHCHDSGEIRGILCGGCNSAAGHAGDSADRLRAIARYLDSASTGVSSLAAAASASSGASNSP
jgi:recombination endonuclease VII